MIYIGVDPGKNGAFAIIGNSATIVMPWDEVQFSEYMLSISTAYPKTTIACVEKVSAMPGQGVTSMFNFGKNAGYIEGVLITCGIPYQLIPPQRWKKEFGLNSDKQKSIEVCKKLFPTADLHRTPRCTTEHDGMAESLLMAEYARRKL